MVVIRRGQSNFKERETLGWAQYCFANELFRFPSRKKSKVICEGVIEQIYLFLLLIC